MILALLLALQDPAEIIVEADRPVVIQGVQFKLTILVPGYTGDVQVTGLRDVSTVHVENGKAELKQAVTDTGEIVVTAGKTRGELKLKFIAGWLCLIPPLLAIVLAILTREVVVSLFAGIWAGSLIVLGLGAQEILLSALRAVDTVIVGEVAKADNIKILLFTILMGAMVGVMTRSGGTKGIVDSVARYAKSPRSGLFSTWLMGVLIFFDDYANCLIIGNTMRPVTDRMKISREKLSYIVDSTAAPVAAIGIISTWIAFEMGLIVSTGVIAEPQMYQTFLALIPYRFYCVLTVLFVLFISLTLRDFGPMLRAEVRAATTGQVIRPEGRPLAGQEITDLPTSDDLSRRWHNAAVPVIGLIAVTILALYLTGYHDPDRKEGETRLFQVIGYASSYNSILYGAMAGLLLAAGLAFGRRHLSAGKTMEAAVAGGKAMFLALIILSLAWSIKRSCDEVSTGPWVVAQIGKSFDIRWLPIIVFLISCCISFATGTSWGTMAIMIPIVGPVVKDNPDWTITLASFAAVLDGAVFGDHVSPISDTTIMSSMASSSDHIDHVKTQLPYGAACAVAAVLCYGLVAFKVLPIVSIPIAAAALLGLLFVVGKKVPHATA